MKVIIYSETGSWIELLKRVQNSLLELGLNDFITVEETNDKTLKEELNISDSPALIIEEESIDFKDIIFEWMIPEEDELKTMFLSIIWGGEENSCCWDSCCSDNDCEDDNYSCGWGCSCGH
jgi:hypothetical protein